MVILIDVKKKKGTSDLRHKLLRKLVVHFIFLIKCSLEVSSKMVKKIVELISQLMVCLCGLFSVSVTFDGSYPSVLASSVSHSAPSAGK